MYIKYDIIRISSSLGKEHPYESFFTTVYSRGETFRVYVMLPLLPAFEGQIGTSTGGAVQAVTYWNYNSICRGAQAILKQLALSTS